MERNDFLQLIKNQMQTNESATTSEFVTSAEPVTAFDSVVEDSAVDGSLDAGFDDLFLDEFDISSVTDSQVTVSLDDFSLFDDLLGPVNVTQALEYPTENETTDNVPLTTVATATEKTVETIEESFYDFARLNAWSLEGSPKDIWSKSMPFVANTDEEALKYYLWMRYQLRVSDEVLPLVLQLDTSFVERCQFVCGELSLGIYSMILGVIKEEWYDPEVVGRYALNEECLFVLLELLKAGKINKEEIKWYANSPAQMLAYLKLVKANCFNKILFEQQSPDCNWQVFTEMALNSDLASLGALVPDSTYRSAIINELQLQLDAKQPMALLSYVLNTVSWQPAVVSALQGCEFYDDVEQFITNNFNEDAPSWIFSCFASGWFNATFVKMYPIAWQTRLLTYVKLWGLDWQRFAQQFINSKRCAGLQWLTELEAEHLLSLVDFRQFVLQIAATDDWELLETMSELPKQSTSYNKFMFEEILGFDEVPVRIGDAIVVIGADKKVYYLYLDTALRKSADLLENWLRVTRLTGDAGLLVQCTNCSNLDSRVTQNLCKADSSLLAAAKDEDYRGDPFTYNFNKVLEEIKDEIPSEQVEEVIGAFESGGVGAITMDKTLGFVRENGLSAMLCSKYWKLLLNVTRLYLKTNNKFAAVAIAFHQILQRNGYTRCTIQDTIKWKTYVNEEVLIVINGQYLKYELEAFIYGIDGVIASVIEKQHIVEIEYSESQLKICLE